MDTQLQQLSQQLGQWLLRRQWKLATAESCTGGWIAQVVTAIAGSSAWFDCGFVTYSNEAKQRMLGVSPLILGKYGAVSEQTVAAMLWGTLRNSSADVAIAVSGIAGPGGGSVEKPLGTVCLGWGTRNGQCRVVTHQFGCVEDHLELRRYIRRQAVSVALSTLMINFD